VNSRGGGTSTEGLKKLAAAEAVTRVESGMRLGLGSGSTVLHFLELLGERLREGTLSGLVGVPTSVQTADRARVAGIPLAALEDTAPLDLTVDGADEVDPGLNLIKGLGAALLREKMVARASRSLLIIADEGKRVERLGTKAPLPVEVVAFAWPIHLPMFESLGARPVLRVDRGGAPIVTDNANHVIDCHFPDGIADPAEVEALLCARPGVVGTGLFLELASEVILAGPGGITVLTASGRSPLLDNGARA
jgi:ribose 5-phosphate isomerase A